MNFSQAQVKNEQLTNEQLTDEQLTTEGFVEAELSPEDLKQVVGGDLTVDVSGAQVQI